MKLIGSILVAALAALPAAAVDVPLKNWAPPGKPVLHGDISDLSVFVAVTPCRVVDTRGGAPIVGGKLAAGEVRSYDINSAGAPCTGIPVGVAAYSLNVTVTGTDGGGFISAYPTGPMPSPLTSTVNYTGANQTVANAAVVPCNVFGSIDVVAGVAGTHLIIDINGYYADGSTDNNLGRDLWITGTNAGPMLFVNNKDTTSATATTSAIRAVMSTLLDDVAVIRAEQRDATLGAANFAGLFTTASTSGVGVLGRSGSPDRFTGINTASKGVVGLSNSGWGVLGAGAARGVGGVSVNGAGDVLSEGAVGLELSNLGIYSFDDLGASGAKSFVEPHPTEAGKVIRYVALEGNEAGTYFRGKGRFVGKTATIAVPEDFRFVSLEDGLSVQVTPIGELATAAVVKATLDAIELKSSRDVEFYYLVHGIRRAFPKWEVVKDDGPRGIYEPEGPDSRIERVSRIEEHKRRLVANGTFHPDGTVNHQTAERLGWARRWREEEAARANAARTSQEGSNQ